MLVVEDEVLLRAFASDFLLEAGFKVFEAVNADEAVAVLQARPDIRVVLTDIEMPGSMNGIQLAESIRERWPNITVIMTSGRAVPGSAELPDGVPFITKPYDPATILNLIGSMVIRQVVECDEPAAVAQKVS